MEACERRVQRFFTEHNVRCLFACYTGSIATGLQSEVHSDFDVRFVYVRSLESYFSISDGHLFPESINEINDEVDVEGWELRKFLSMMHQSNVRAFEMLSSPVLAAHCDARTTHALAELTRACFCPKRVMYFYLADARRHARRFLSADKTEVLHKKYFYVVQPLLSILWIRLRGGGGESVMPPLRWDYLLAQMRESIPVPVLVELELLTTNKRAGAYSGANAAKLWPHLAHVDAWYGPYLEDRSQLERDISALPDMDDARKTVLREQMDAMLFNTVTRVNDWYRK